jgi:cation diffusion facilitator family transporter
MHIQSLHKWTHSHNFNVDDGHAERNTRRVILLTVFMMVIEISAGYLFGSMALLADGWHMGTHAVALGIAAFTYYYARLNSDNPNYSFGTGKVGVLGGFASAVVLAIVALLMGIESIERVISPKQIHFNEAIAVAVIGLIVNIVSALLLQDRHHHSEGHNSDKIHQDHNLKAAYLHVMADALTSLLAIIALFTGKMFGWIWMDPIMGIVGALLITRWSYRLLIDTGKILLDRDINQEAVAEIPAKIESDSDNKVSDIHVWRVGSYHLSAIISIVTDYPKPPEYYKTLLADYEELVHVTVEVIKCDDEACVLQPEPAI